jgi:hypothetical protein
MKERSSRIEGLLGLDQNSQVKAGCSSLRADGLLDDGILIVGFCFGV